MALDRKPVNTKEGAEPRRRTKWNQRQPGWTSCVSNLWSKSNKILGMRLYESISHWLAGRKLLFVDWECTTKQDEHTMRKHSQARRRTNTMWNQRPSWVKWREWPQTTTECGYLNARRNIKHFEVLSSRIWDRPWSKGIHNSQQRRIRESV